MVNWLALGALARGYQQAEGDRIQRAQHQQALDAATAKAPYELEKLKAQVGALRPGATGTGTGRGRGRKGSGASDAELAALAPVLAQGSAPAPGTAQGGGAPGAPDLFAQPMTMNAPTPGLSAPGASAGMSGGIGLPAAPAPGASAMQYFPSGPGAAPLPQEPAAPPPQAAAPAQPTAVERYQQIMMNPQLSTKAKLQAAKLLTPLIKAERDQQQYGLAQTREQRLAEAANAREDQGTASLEARAQQYARTQAERERHAAATERTAAMGQDLRAYGINQKHVDALIAGGFTPEQAIAGARAIGTGMPAPAPLAPAAPAAPSPAPAPSLQAQPSAAAPTAPATQPPVSDTSRVQARISQLGEADRKSLKEWATTKVPQMFKSSKGATRLFHFTDSQGQTWEAYYPESGEGKDELHIAPVEAR